eukprot:Gregarina_sp_Poly_1__3719@NODE_209_length_11372_cov_428_789120_g186_i0_p1_GENE_NODE_209_length_11372_cov_428_789120_g186_i0NODE_209_length_11372_cov_428_789120_g186_i0_p1_ORF_typecomplete_len530_score61_91Exostosin/PF03016_15/1_9e11_NODE_209_length_11372_cov_428_789120_g186_i060047593
MLLLAAWVQAVCASIVYPIDKAALVPCGQNKGSWLCRPSPKLSTEAEQYIQTLHIQDPSFYDAFTEEEIFRWFKPIPAVKIPFYIWEKPSLSQDVLQNVPSFLQDMYATFVQDLKTSGWRTEDKSGAVLHFVAIPWFPWVVPGTHWDREVRGQYVVEVNRTARLNSSCCLQIMNSEEYRRFNGSNFLFVTSHFLPEAGAIHRAQDFFDLVVNGANPSAFSITRAGRFMGTAPALHYGAAADARICMVTTHYSSSEALRSLPGWPLGVRESYRYPLGQWAQMQQNRHNNIFFLGLADYRFQYAERLEMLARWSETCNNTIIARVGEGPTELKPCSKESLCKCVLPERLHGGQIFEKSIMDSLFSLHLRGDDFYSARIVDIIASGSVPVVIDKRMHSFGMSGQCHAPWKRMAIYVDREKFMRNPMEAIAREIAKKSHHELEQMVRLLFFYRLIMIHGMAVESRVVESRLTQFVTDCVTEEILQEMNLTKADKLCHFEETTARAAFLSTGDADDNEPPWRASFLRFQEFVKP